MTYLQETGTERGIGADWGIDSASRHLGEFAQHVKQVFGLDSLRMVHYQEIDLQSLFQEWLSVAEGLIFL